MFIKKRKVLYFYVVYYLISNDIAYEIFCSFEICDIVLRHSTNE